MMKTLPRPQLTAADNKPTAIEAVHAWSIKSIKTLVNALALLMVGALVLVQQAANAQTATPGITIDTTSLFSQINTWTTALDDVIFLGIAIAIAIALLTFIGNQILKAFKGGGAR
jgi:hypothetical protein